MQDREIQFLDALYLGVRDRVGFDASLHMLCGLFDVSSATLLDFDAARPEVSAHASIGVLSGEVLRRYEREFAPYDPAPRAFMALRPGKAMGTYQLLPEENRKPGIFFAEFFRPSGLEECLGGTLASSGGCFAMVGLQRPPDRKAFDDADTVRLERLMPHLGRALQLRRQFIELEGVTGALSEVCDRLSAGVVALDDHGRSLFVNRAARDIAAANDGLSIDRRGCPLVSNRGASIRLAELEKDVRCGGAGGIVRVPRADDRQPYGVLVASFFLEGEVERERPRRRGVIFVIHDPLLRCEPSARTIATLFNLPQATAALVAAAADDVDLKDYAERAGISMNTVRYHLKTAYARTGVSGLTELVRLVTAALRDLADCRQH